MTVGMVLSIAWLPVNIAELKWTSKFVKQLLGVILASLYHSNEKVIISSSKSKIIHIQVTKQCAIKGEFTLSTY